MPLEQVWQILGQQVDVEGQEFAQEQSRNTG